MAWVTRRIGRIASSVCKGQPTAIRSVEERRIRVGQIEAPSQQTSSGAYPSFLINRRITGNDSLQALALRIKGPPPNRALSGAGTRENPIINRPRIEPRPFGGCTLHDAFVCDRLSEILTHEGIRLGSAGPLFQECEMGRGRFYSLRGC